MDYEILQVLPFSREVLLVLYAQDGQKKPAFVLEDGFQAGHFAAPPKPEQTAVVELTLDTWLWQSFQTSCANLEITPEDYFNAWLYFWVSPNPMKLRKRCFAAERSTEWAHF